MDRFLSRFDYGHASVRLHCVSWWVVGQFMTSGLSCSPLHIQDGEAALFIASSEGHDQIVELLLRREANVNHQTKVSLFMIVCVGRLQSVDWTGGLDWWTGLVDSSQNDQNPTA